MLGDRCCGAGAPQMLPRGWCSAQRIKNPMIAGGNHTTIPSCRQSALRNRLVTEEECGRKCSMTGNPKTYSSLLFCNRPFWRPDALRGISVRRPHSSSDPFGATFPPGEGIGGRSVHIGIVPLFGFQGGGFAVAGVDTVIALDSGQAGQALDHLPGAAAGEVHPSAGALEQGVAGE